MKKIKKLNLKEEYIFPKLDKSRLGLCCLQCGKILVSYHRHDFRTCGCPNETMVDGGDDYFRYGGVDFSKFQIVEISPKVMK